MRWPTTRHLVLIGAILVGVSTAATSAVSLYSLAMACGIPRILAAALPIALDAGAAVATLLWITERNEVRAWGRGIAVTALVGTLAGNGLAHAVDKQAIHVGLPLILIVGACIPAMLGSTVHLAALMARTGDPAPTAVPAVPAVPTAQKVDQPAPPERPDERVPAGKISPPGSTTKPPARRPSRRAEGLAYARSRWPDVTGAEIAIKVGVAKSEGDRIKSIIKREMEAAS
jgi:hypothetical protein